MKFLFSRADLIFEYHFGNFFSDVTKGEKGKSDIKYKPFYNIKDVAGIERIMKSYVKHNGHFDDHISKSIPGHKEVQLTIANAVVKLLKRKNGCVLDIGGSEGSWAKSISDASGGKVKTTVLDPNKDMMDKAKESEVKGSEFICKAFMDGFDDIEKYEPETKFDVIHESMTFQFISSRRTKQIDYLKKNLLKYKGVFITEEKVTSDKWLDNEELKDAYKKVYYSQKELDTKSKEILKGDENKGMNTYLVSKTEYERILKNNFKYVFQYWNGGNFVGYICSDSNINIHKMKRNINLPSFASVVNDFLKSIKNEGFRYLIQ